MSDDTVISDREQIVRVSGVKPGLGADEDIRTKGCAGGAGFVNLGQDGARVAEEHRQGTMGLG